MDALSTQGPLCDDCASEVTQIQPRQAINQICRKLLSEGTLFRAIEQCPRCRRQKTINRLKTGVHVTKPQIDEARSNPPARNLERPWYWEGNVQRRLVDYLRSKGFTIESESDTATRAQGKDVVARDAQGAIPWVTVKGFPDKSKNTQARHWFAGALMDLARYKDEDHTASLAMALPHGFTTYENLLDRTKRTRSFFSYHVFWVHEDGSATQDKLDTVND